VCVCPDNAVTFEVIDLGCRHFAWRLSWLCLSRSSLMVKVVG